MKQDSGDRDVEMVKPEELKQRIEAGEEFLVLDARYQDTHEEWSMEPGKGDVWNVPYIRFEDGVPDDVKETLENEDREVVVTCNTGNKSREISEKLHEELDVDVMDLEGGMTAWANIYESEKFELENGELIQYMRPSTGCLAYLVKSESDAAVIDPLRSFTGRYVEDAGDLRYAIDTHIHADHVSGVRELGEREETTPVIPEAARERDVTYIDDVKTVEDGDILEVGSIEIEAVHTPGHTTGMTSYLIDGEVLATGDGLFVESVARPDLEKGDEGAEEQAGQLYETLQNKVLEFEDDVYIAPGHFSSSAEKKDGLYMRELGELREEMEPLSYTRERFIEFIVSDMPPRPANYQDIIPTNLGKQKVTDDEAFEMELGPNNCAATEDSMT